MIDFKGIEKKFQNLLEMPEQIRHLRSDVNNIWNVCFKEKPKERSFVLVLIQGFKVELDKNSNFHCGGAQLDKNSNFHCGGTQLDTKKITNKPVTMAVSAYAPHSFSFQPDIEMGNLQVGVICDVSRVRINQIQIANVSLSPGVEASPFSYFDGIIGPWNRIFIDVSER